MKNKSLNSYIRAIFYIVIYIIGAIVVSIGGVIPISIGIGIIIGETIFLFKKMIDFINRKEKRTKIIIYSISGTIFGLIFLFLFISNTIEITTRYKEISTFTQYSIGTITNITNDNIVISCVINGNEINFNYETNDTLQIGDNLAVYFNPNNLSNYSLINPNINKMLYLMAYFIITIPTFLLAKISLSNLYYTFKPKKEENKVKIKR